MEATTSTTTSGPTSMVLRSVPPLLLACLSCSAAYWTLRWAWSGGNAPVSPGVSFPAYAAWLTATAATAALVCGAVVLGLLRHSSTEDRARAAMFIGMFSAFASFHAEGVLDVFVGSLCAGFGVWVAFGAFSAVRRAIGSSGRDGAGDR